MYAFLKNIVCQPWLLARQVIPVLVLFVSGPALGQFAPGYQMIAVYLNYANDGDSDIVFIDLSTNEITHQISIDHAAAHDIVLSPDNTLAYVSAQNGNEVHVVDIAARAIVGSFPALGAREMYIAPEGKFGYVSEMFNGGVQVVDLTTLTTVSTIKSIQNPWIVEPTLDHGLLYVGGVDTYEMKVIDLSTNEIIASFVLDGVPEEPTNGQPSGLAISPDGKFLFVTGFPLGGPNAWTSEFFVVDIDPASPTYHQVVKQPDVPTQAKGVVRDIAIEPGGQFAYVVTSSDIVNPNEDGSVLVLDIATQEFTDRIPIGSFAWKVVFLPDGSLAYVSNNLDRSISLIDPSTHAVIGAIDFFGRPKAMAIAPADVGTSVQAGSTLPGGYALHQNYPNPFNPTTRIEFEIPESDHVTVSILDALGRHISTLMEQTLSAGSHTVAFDGSGMSSGTYFVRLTVPQGSATTKMILLK